MKTKIALLAAALLAAPAAHAAFKCVDERGLTHIGDTPPPGCANVVMYETSRSGSVIRKIEPTLTPDQVKVRQQEQEKQKVADKAAAAQRRKDEALLATFSGEREFDVVRDRNIEPINGRIRVATERIKEIEKREAKLAEELEFYKAGKSKSAKDVTPPQTLTAEQERLKAEKDNLASSIGASEREIQQIRARFDVDKKRWVELKGAKDMPAQAQQVRKTY